MLGYICDSCSNLIQNVANSKTDVFFQDFEFIYLKKKASISLLLTAGIPFHPKQNSYTIFLHLASAVFNTSLIPTTNHLLTFTPLIVFLS